MNGWKVIFKLTLLILKNYEEELLAMSFEQMLGLLTSLPHKFLITSAEQLKKDFDA